MLQFFRKYQQYFFIVITVIIIISFSFFGTYSTLSDNPVETRANEKAFTAIDGEAVSRRQVENLSLFIATDSEDKKLYGGAWGPNFLNDGVIKRDFLETGLANIIIARYPQYFKEELASRQKRELHDTLYSHPQAQFIGVEMVWSYFAPEMIQHYKALKKEGDPLSPSSFDHRVRLYLGQKQLSPPILQQILNYQQQQYSWISPDPTLQRRDLSLFGYHSLDDWFGPAFTRVAAELIINGAKEAEKRGYKVTKEEALASLSANAAASFRENSNSPFMSAANSGGYLQEQLQRMGLDKRQAVALWQQVLLFRRLFEEMGNSMFVDPSTFAPFDNYANTTAKGTLYQLPAALQFDDENSAIASFEGYLKAVAPADKGGALPQEFLSADEVYKNAPYLVQKRYLVEIAAASTQELQERVPLREVWSWEGEEANWKKLQEEFPTVGILKASNTEERLKGLDTLDTVTRNKVDAAARAAIVASHPDWLKEALAQAPVKHETLNLVPAKQNKAPLPGVADSTALITLLDAAPLGEAASPYSGDGIHYYAITLLDRSGGWELLTFEEAKNRQLLENIKAGETKKPSARFVKQLEQVAAALKAAPEEARSRWLATQEAPHADNSKLAARPAPADQWRLQAIPFASSRSKPTDPLEIEALLAMEEGSWSKVVVPGDKAPYFYQVEKRTVTDRGRAAKTEAAHKLLGGAAEQALMKQLMEAIDAKGAIDISFLSKKSGAEGDAS